MVAPDTAPATKIAAIERLGGRVIKVPFERWWETFETRRYPGVEGTFIHAFDDPHVMAGNGTIGLEVLEDLPAVAAIVVPWGGGGLACGIAAAVRARRPECRVFAAEVETAAPLSAALAAGEPRAVAYQPSFVDGIGSKIVFASMLERARGLVEGCPGRDARRGPVGGPAARRTQPRRGGGRGRLPRGLCALGRRGSGADRVHRVRRQHRPRPLRVARRPGPTPRAVSQAHAFAGDLQAADTSRARSVL